MSKFQKRVKFLITKVLGKVPISEEVNVKKLFPEYGARNHHYDLVIPSYNLVIECHGEQHRKLTTFGEKDIVKAKENFVRQKWRDRAKEDIVWDNDWAYVKIWYDDLPKDNDKAATLIKKEINSALDKIEDEEY